MILEREEKISIYCSTYLCIHWLLLVYALTGDRTTTLAYWDDALTNWAIQPEPVMPLNCTFKMVKKVNSMLCIFCHNNIKIKWNQKENWTCSFFFLTKTRHLPPSQKTPLTCVAFCSPGSFLKVLYHFSLRHWEPTWFRVISRILSIIKLSLSWIFTEALFSQLSKHSSHRKPERWIVLDLRCTFMSEFRHIWQFPPLNTAFE